MKRMRRLFGSNIAIASLSVFALIVTPPSNVHAGMIVNGDFEFGNMGFTSGYTYTPGINSFPGLNGGEYNIVTNPNPFHFAAASYV